MLINCPNCGAPLTSDGYCNYCKTKVRYANHLEIISDDIMHMCDVEILLKIKKGDILNLIPFVGHVDELEFNYDSTTLYCDNSPYASFANNPTVHISFTGGIGSIPDEEMNQHQKKALEQEPTNTKLMLMEANINGYAQGLKDNIMRCKDCKYFEKWRSLEAAKKHGQLYSCSLLVISNPSPDDHCSKAESKEESEEI